MDVVVELAVVVVQLVFELLLALELLEVALLLSAVFAVLSLHELASVEVVESLRTSMLLSKSLDALPTITTSPSPTGTALLVLLAVAAGAVPTLMLAAVAMGLNVLSVGAAGAVAGSNDPPCVTPVSDETCMSTLLKIAVQLCALLSVLEGTIKSAKLPIVA